MPATIRSLFAIGTLALATQAGAQVTFYEQEGFQGRSFSTQQRHRDLHRAGFDDRASSVVVVGQRWQACEDARFDGRCTVLRPGRYASMAALGLDKRISSVRPLRADAYVAEADYAPMPQVPQDFRRRRDERLFEAEVTSARAVVGTPGQRCWIERERVAQQPQQGSLNLGGAAVGALIGGILGHQVGGGSGKDAATIGGAVAGAAIGSQVGGGSAVAGRRDVQKCQQVVNTQPAYWDVTYVHAGVQHRVQLASAPGPTIPVDAATGAPLVAGR